MSANTITVVGNLTREPEMRFTNAGKAVVSFGIAVSHRFQQNNEWQERTSFYNVTAWDQLAENAAASLSKGARVLVAGRPEIREYEGRDGGKRLSVDITADEIGASLRWATVVVERNERSGPGADRQQSRQQAKASEWESGGFEEPF